MLKKALAAVSALPLLLGAALTGGFALLAARGEEPSGIMLLAGLALLAQGGYSLLYAWAWRPHQALSRPMTRLLVGGQLAALAVGNAAFLQGALYNLQPRHGDQEWLPMTAGALMAVHAAAVLAYVWLRDRRAAETA